MQASLYRNLPPFFRSEKWIEPFYRAVRNNMDVSRTTAWLYHVKIQMLHIPYLIQSLRRLHDGVQDGPSTSHLQEGIDDGPTASHLLSEAVTIAESLHVVDVSFIRGLKQQKHIQEVKVQAAETLYPFKWAYDFASHEATQLFVWHATISIIINRIIEQLLSILGTNSDPDSTFETSYREWSRRIWLSSIFARKGRPLSSIYFLNPFCPIILSYEAANPKVRAWLMEAFNDMVEHRKEEGYCTTEESFLYFCKALTGRERIIWPSNTM